MLLVDAAGRRFGLDPFSDTFHREIPAAAYEPVGTGIGLRLPAEGKYELQVIGTAPARYDYVLQAWDRSGRQRCLAALKILGEPAQGEQVMRYGIVIEKAAHNYSAYVPDLAGCVATGQTVEEVEREIREAIRFHIEGLRDAGLPVPSPTTICDYVEA